MLTNKVSDKMDIQWFAQEGTPSFEKEDEPNITGITLEQVKVFLEANREKDEVSDYLKQFQTEKELNTEVVNAYLDTPAGMVILQPRLDSFATKAIKTHDEKQAPVLEAKIKQGINEAIARMHPEETLEQKQIRELRENMEAMQKESEAKELKNKILYKAKEMNVPMELVNGFPYPSEEHFVNAATIYNKLLTKEVEKQINEKIAASSYKPKTGDRSEENKVDLSKLTTADLIKMEMSGELDKQIAG